LSLDLLDRRGL